MGTNKLFLRNRGLLLAVLTGLLFLLSWPGIGGFWPFILVAFVPLFELHREEREGRLSSSATRWLTLLAFAIMNAGALYFLFFIQDNVGVRLLSFLTPVIINTLWMTAAFRGYARFSRYFGMGLGALFFVGLWMSLEWMQHHWTLAFPWLSLGNVLGPHPADAQWYAATGVGGGALWIWVANFALFGVIRTGQNAMRWLVFFALWVLVPTAWSRWAFSQPVEEGASLDFAIVQPCLDNYNEKFEPDDYSRRIRGALNMLGDRSMQGGVLVLPETFLYESSSVSGSLSDLKFRGLWVNHLDHSEGVRMLRNGMSGASLSGVITGAFTSRFYALGEGAPAFAVYLSENGDRAVHYNSAIVIEREKVEVRHKGVLVAGVERIPFSEYFPVLEKWALDLGGVVGSLGQAESIAPVEVAGVSMGVQICYDSAFGWLSRQLARDGASVQVILTNDSWWGETPGYLQLLSFAQLRAIETGLPVVRAANSGVSAFIDQRGELLSQIPWGQMDTVVHRVNLRESDTLYTRLGDYPYFIAATALPVILLLAWWRRRKERKHQRFIA